MKLGHIVKYHNVFFKFHNGSYFTMPLRAIALFSRKITIFDGALSFKTSNFDPNFMKFGLNVQYHNVFQDQ